MKLTEEQIEKLLVLFAKEYKKTQDEAEKYISQGGVKPNEVVFDVTDVGGSDIRFVISDALEEFEKRGVVESYWIAGVGEGAAFFTDEGLKILDEKENDI